MVMPRSRSISMESSTCSTISRWARPPVVWISRSASVDLPWSIWAMMAKLRMLSMAAFMARGLAFELEGGKHARPDGCGPPATKTGGSLRRQLVLGEERLERDRLAGACPDGASGRPRLPVRALPVEGLRHHDHVADRFAVVERVGVVVGGVAEGVEVVAVGERGREAQRLPVSAAADQIGDGREHARRRPDRIL